MEQPYCKWTQTKDKNKGGLPGTSQNLQNLAMPKAGSIASRLVGVGSLLTLRSRLVGVGSRFKLCSLRVGVASRGASVGPKFSRRRGGVACRSCRGGVASRTKRVGRPKSPRNMGLSRRVGVPWSRPTRRGVSSRPEDIEAYQSDKLLGIVGLVIRSKLLSSPTFGRLGTAIGGRSTGPVPQNHHPKHQQLKGRALWPVPGYCC